MIDEKAGEATGPVDATDAKSAPAESTVEAPVAPVEESNGGGSSLAAKIENMMGAVKEKFSSRG